MFTRRFVLAAILVGSAAESYQTLKETAPAMKKTAITSNSGSTPTPQTKTTGQIQKV